LSGKQDTANGCWNAEVLKQRSRFWKPGNVVDVPVAASLQPKGFPATTHHLPMNDIAAAESITVLQGRFKLIQNSCSMRFKASNPRKG
jgi:hypothetical protein